MKRLYLLIVFVLLPLSVFAQFENKEQDLAKLKGNRFSQSFYDVKKIMLDKIYYDHRRTLYCDATFNEFKQITLPQGFKLPNLRKVDFKVYEIEPEDLRQKAERMEWEHIVPAQNFGKTFTEWKRGHRNCVSGNGKRFKGRSCAVQENEEFRYMYTDMYNLYPSIGAVNYLRGNFNFTQFGAEIPNTFGHCNMKISHNKAEPDDAVKGLIARTYFYMQETYPRYKIGEPMQKILAQWAKTYPLSEWECVRAYRIEKIQGNADNVVKQNCRKKGWYHQ